MNRVQMQPTTKATHILEWLRVSYISTLLTTPVLGLSECECFGGGCIWTLS